MVDHTNADIQGLDTAGLLKDIAWLEGLARQLVSGDERAKDLAQEAWAIALSRPRPAGAPLRSWLSVVVRNCASSAQRSEGRLKGRERWVAKVDSETPADVLSEHAEQQKLLLGAVHALPPKYREVVLLKFFGGLKPRQIAQHLELPVDTVRTRTQRALERLREGLDRDFDGDRSAWGMALTQWNTPDSGLVSWSSLPKAKTIFGWMMTKPVAALSLVAVGVGMGMATWNLTPQLLPSQVEKAEENPPSAESLVRYSQQESSAGHEAREPVPLAAFWGLLVDEYDRPIAGAHLSWTSYASDIQKWSEEVTYDHWTLSTKQFEAKTVWANSDSKGRFSFQTAPPLSETDHSVIWATHLDHIAAAILLDASPDDWSMGDRLTMDTSVPIAARVVDGESQSVPGAMIDEFAIVPPTKAIQVPLKRNELVRLFLRRSFVSDSQGQVQLPAFPGQLHLQANTELTISQAWAGAAPANVKLILAPSFIAGGQLTLRGGASLYGQELSMVVDAWKGDFSRPIGKFSFDYDNLTWGPVRIPIVNGDRFSFSLRAITVVPRTKFISAPKAGERVVIDFESTTGQQVWFGIMNGSNEFLKEGLVEISWEEPNDHGTVTLKLRADGYAVCMACPPGGIATIRGSAPGYAPASISGFNVPEEESVVHAITLLPAGQVTGRVLSNGSPVSDFNVVVWPTESPSDMFRQKFIGAEDGMFELSNAPMGNIQILASADHGAPSRTDSIKVVQGETEHITLELQSPHAAQGQVLDEAGAPLSSATIQPFIEDGWKRVGNRGTTIAVDQEGRFHLEGLPPGRLGFTVSAPGYSPEEQWAKVQSGKTLELESIRLSPLRGLEIRFLFPAEVNTTLYSVGIGDRGDVTHSGPLDNRGTFRAEAVGVATRIVRLYSPDGTTIGLKLPPPTGRNWVVEYPMPGTAKIIIQLDTGTGAKKISAAAWVRMDTYARGEDSSFIAQSLRNNTTGDVVFDRVLPGTYIAQLTEGGIQALASTLVTVADGETTYATISLDNEDSVFKIVDGRGDPISGVTLSVYVTEYPLWRRTTSNAEGLCTISGSPAMDAFAGLQHPSVGDLWGVPVELGKGPNNITEIEFVAEQAVRLRILDGEVPLGAVTCRLNASANRNVDASLPRMTALDGLASFENLGPAVYGVDLSGPGVWPKKIEIKASDNSTATTIQLRRIGDLHFQVVGSAGQPLADVAVELTSLEFETNAEVWIQQGKLLTVPPSTKTDSTGSLTFPGIPHGKYRWHIPTSSGDGLQGLVEVPAGDQAIVPVALQ